MTDITLSPWIETHSGRKFEFLSPTPDMVDIDDIAHSLSRQCRFSGHTSKFYSVAEHSINVSLLSTNKLEGLLHDASEAYLLDIPSPIKQYLTNYKEIEHKVMCAIADKFGFWYPLPPDIKDADHAQLKTEAKHLLPSQGKDWADQYQTKIQVGITPKCLVPDLAKEMFLGMFEMINQLKDSEELASKWHSLSKN